MIKSMTGYGRASNAEAGISLSIEIKAVNHRFCDVSLRAPRQLAALEPGLRKKVSGQAQRGKIDLFINLEKEEELAVEIRPNRALIAAYQAALDDLGTQLGRSGDVSLEWLANQKDILSLVEQEVDMAALKVLLEATLDQALSELDQMRTLEGAALEVDMRNRCQLLADLLGQIGERASVVPQEWLVRLQERLNKLNSDVEIDPQRIAQEFALFADRCDISEERVRFQSHLEQFLGLLEADEPVGRKMDFLLQELNRETNTIGSKANDAELGTLVVNVKAELEKIREQVQNVV